MKNLLCVSIFILAFSLSAFSQTTENSNCPTIQVSGPAGITNPGETMSFTVNLDEKAENYIIEFNWSVSDGNEIVEGQGTSTIKVLPKDIGGNVTVTVEIKGLLAECPNIASETSIICPPPSPVHIDEFSLSELRIDKARIDYLLIELENNPTDQGYIIEKFKRNTPKATIKNKLKKLSDYIVKIRGFDPTRITIVHDFADENLTQFWRVPPGAENPTID